MKIGSGRGAATIAHGGDEGRAEGRGGGRDFGGKFAGIVADHGAAQPVAGVIMAEGRFIRFAILLRLAEREMEVEDILALRLAIAGQGFERALHRGDVGGVELHGLEVGEAPPGFAHGRAMMHGLAIGMDRVGLSPQRLERMAQILPDLRLVGTIGQQAFINGACRVLIAQPHQHRCADEVIARIMDRRAGEGFGMGQRFAQAVVLQQQADEEIAGEVEAGCQRDGTLDMSEGGIHVAAPPLHLTHEAGAGGIVGQAIGARRQQRGRVVQ